MSTPDPFDTAELRAATLQNWRRSPTRLREDTATEADLVQGGYRDRVLTELAQNAADAAARAGVRGELTVRLVDNELRVANTGAPLDRGGVQALAALRASSKTSGVGRFGVGFTAVLAVSEEPRVLSRSGSIAFSAARTRAELGITDVPALRLVWPVEQQPTAEASTEVVLPLRPGIDGAGLLRAFATEAPELLLAFPALQSISVSGTLMVRADRPLASGLDEVSIGRQLWWRSGRDDVRWLVPVSSEGQVQPLAEDVLRAPTRTDEELSLPALVIADVALQPDRRRLLPGTSLRAVAQAYPELVAALPPEQRTQLVPLPGFPRSAVDAELRDGVLAALRDAPWLSAAAGDDLKPRAAQVLERANPELVGLLADIIPGLLGAELSAPVHAAALVALEIPRLRLAEVADVLAGVQREAGWWRRLYAALDPLVPDRRAAEELAALPVPLADGRTVLGPRSTIVAELTVAVPGVRVVHPDATHPLLLRLGSVAAGPDQLLDDELLRQAVHEADPDDVTSTAELATAVLALVDAAGVLPGEHTWLGELLLPDTDGELRSADELLLPDAPLRAVLDTDAPFGTVAPSVVAEYGARLLQAVGVGWGFTVLVDDDATGPEHELDGEELWWDATPSEPTSVVAVRDLDLVDSQKWAQALQLLCAEPETLAALREPNGYTAWWLRTHAELYGAPLGHWRHPDDAAFEALLDAVPVAGLPPVVLASTTVDSVALAALLLDRLGDASRSPSVAVIVRTHAALAAAVEAGTVAVDDLEPPKRVRVLSGVIADTAAAAVLDQPWLQQVLSDDGLVLGGLGDAAATLADLLDLPLASEDVMSEVVSGGVPMRWSALPEAVLACTRLGVAVPDDSFVLHETLTVRCADHQHEVGWWVEDGVLHAQRRGMLDAAVSWT